MAEEYSKDATALVNIIHRLGNGDRKEDRISAYSSGLHVIWLLMTILSGVALVSCAFVKEFSLVQEYRTRQGFSHDSRENTVGNKE